MDFVWLTKKIIHYFRTSVSLRQDENKLFSELIHKPNGLHWHGLGAKRNICAAVQMLRSKGMQVCCASHN